MKIALLQINPTVGDLAGNARADLPTRCAKPARRGADLAVTPELALVGYLPRDLLLSAGVRRAAAGTRSPALARDAARPAAGARRPAGAEPVRRRTAALQHRGAAARRPRRAAVPQGAAADLRRLRRGPLLRAVSRRADARARRPPARHQHLRGRLERSRLLEAPPLSPRSDRRAGRAPAPTRSSTCRRRRSPSASTRGAKRCSAAWRASTACRSSTCNQFGGNDDLVFDGRSCAFDAAGAPIARGRVVRRRRRHLRSRRGRADRAGRRSSTPESEIWRALVLGTRDYARKCGFTQRRARPVGRHRLGADRRDRGRGARRRPACSAC